MELAKAVWKNASGILSVEDLTTIRQELLEEIADPLPPPPILRRESKTYMTIL